MSYLYITILCVSLCIVVKYDSFNSKRCSIILVYLLISFTISIFYKIKNIKKNRSVFRW